MNKLRAKINFVLTSILLIIAVVLCFAQFNLPGSNNYFNGLLNSINATSEITTGQSAVYQIESEDVSLKETEKTRDKILEILDSQKFVGSKVYIQGDKIRAEVESKSNSEQILSIIGSSKTFFITALNKEDGEVTVEDLSAEDYYIDGTDVEYAKTNKNFQYNTEINGITIRFNAEGKEKLKQLTKQISVSSDKNLYFYIDGQKSTELPVEEVNNTGVLSFYSPSYSEEDAQNYALQILMASTGVKLKTISNSTTTATLGNYVVINSLIAIAIVLLAVLILFPIIFGDFGFLADMSVIISVVFGIFLLQALPFTTSSVASIFGMALGLVLVVVCHTIYLSKIKSEFKYLGKLKLSVKTGFKKSWLKNLDICVIAFLASLSLVFWNIPYLSTFAISLSIMAFVSLFTTVVVLKDFVTWYININPKNYKRVKFTKGEINE